MGVGPAGGCGTRWWVWDPLVGVWDPLVGVWDRWWLLHWESDLSSWWARTCCWRLATALQSLAWVGRLGILVTVGILVTGHPGHCGVGGSTGHPGHCGNCCGVQRGLEPCRQVA